MRKLVIFGAALFAATLSLTSSASAQQCECVNGIKCYRLPDGTLNCDPNVTCGGDFSLTPPIPENPKQPTNSVAAAQTIVATVRTPLGPTTITSDPNRPTQQRSRVASLSTSSLNPVAVDIIFNGIATVPGLSRRLVNVEEIHYRSSLANYPFKPEGEKLTLQNRVNFVYEGTTQIVFTLEPGQSIINLRSR